MTKTILIGHGSGGLMTTNLIRDVFLKNFGNTILDHLSDAAVTQAGKETIAFTTDSFVVDPVFFPGGNIGNLAVCGTVNDLSVTGATPLYLSCGFIIEEGFSINELEKIASAMADEAKKAGIQIVTGDTKVVKKGQCDRIFINTSGIGIIAPGYTHISKGLHVKAGDRIIVNGFLGDHEIAILAAREQLEFDQPVKSDVAPLNHMIGELLNAGIDIHFMRDITRGGIGTVLSELAGKINIGITIDESVIPVREQVAGACEIYGFNPLYLANEGKVMLVIAEKDAKKAVELLRKNEYGREARMIGEITDTNRGKVIMNSVIGSKRIIDKLTGEQLPRIC